MGDRFYLQQQKYKPKRKLKKDFIDEINALLETNITGLDKCTINTLNDLIAGIEGIKNG